MTDWTVVGSVMGGVAVIAGLALTFIRLGDRLYQGRGTSPPQTEATLSEVACKVGECHGSSAARDQKVGDLEKTVERSFSDLHDRLDSRFTRLDADHAEAKANGKEIKDKLNDLGETVHAIDKRLVKVETKMGAE